MIDFMSRIRVDLIKQSTPCFYARTKLDYHPFLNSLTSHLHDALCLL